MSRMRMMRVGAAALVAAALAVGSISAPASAAKKEYVASSDGKVNEMRDTGWGP